MDRADLPLPALPPGAYRLEIGIYRMDTFERLPVTQAGEGSTGTSLTLTTIEVR